MVPDFSADRVLDFDVLGSDAIADAVDMIGPWVPNVTSTASNVTFSTAKAPEELIWRVRLSPDRALASQRMTAAAAQLESTRSALGRLERSLARLVPSPISEEEVSRCRAFFESAMALLDPRARVQTYVEGRLIGWTVLPIAGRPETVVDTRADAHALQLHVRSVDLTVLSRATLMRLVLLIARSTARWSVAMATPLAPAAGVVAAWKIADDVMREERWFRSRLNAAQSSTPIS
ncbi:MAG TPA: hypothetical protein VGJ60_12385 [Chloroflexota bacterium]